MSTQYSDIFLCFPDVDFYLSSENNGLATDSFKPRYFSSENNEWDTKDTRETFRICSFKYDRVGIFSTMVASNGAKNWQKENKLALKYNHTKENTGLFGQNDCWAVFSLGPNGL